MVEISNKIDGIYSCKEEETSELTKQNYTKIYTILGSHDILDSGYPILSSNKEELAYAKKEIIQNKEYYYIKLDDEGNLFNPLNPSPNNKSRKFKLMGAGDWQYIKVQEDCFNYYIDFLKTKNKLMLKFAERNR